MFWKDLDKEDLGLKKYVYLAIRDVSNDLGLAPGMIGCNIANLYTRAVVQQHDTFPTSTYNKTVVLISEEWIEECGDPTIIYREVAKEVRYIYQHLSVNWYLNKIIEFKDESIIEQWAYEIEYFNFNDSDVRKNEELECNLDAINYSVDKAIKFSAKYYEEQLT